MFSNVTRNTCFLTKLCLETASLSKRLAGHSKWQNIRHIKAAKDAQKGDTFTKLTRQLKLAAQEGGSPDPKLNLKLEQVVEQAKRFNMPIASINSILKQIQNSKDNAKGYLLEIKGPGGAIILCEVLTPNAHQTKQQISSVIRKHSSRYTDGSGIHLFDEKGIILAVNPSTPRDVLEMATDHAIHAGAEDVRLLSDGTLEFSCGKTNLNKVREGLEECGYEIKSASVEFIPNTVQQLTEEEMETCARMYEKLEAMPEVVRLSDNIA